MMLDIWFQVNQWVNTLQSDSQVLMADSEEVNCINQESQFIDMLWVSGCTTTLTVGYNLA